MRHVHRTLIDPFQDPERKHATGNSRILSALFLLQTVMYAILTIHVASVAAAGVHPMIAIVIFSCACYLVSRTRFYKASVFAFVAFQSFLIPFCMVTVEPSTVGYNSTVMWLVTGPIAASLVLTFRETLYAIAISSLSYGFLLIWSLHSSYKEMHVQIVFFIVTAGLLMVAKRLRERMWEELEREKIKSQQNARLASVGILAAGIAHELNTPLASIVTSAELIDINLTHEPVQVDEIDVNNQRILEVAFGMSEIIKSLKSYASSEPLRSTTTLSLKELVDAVELNLTDRLPDAHPKLEVARHFSDINCEIDLKVMVQALTNLVQNSFEAQLLGNQESKIELVVIQKNETASIQIIDNGKGVDDSLAGKIFDPFVTTKPFGKGPGLGLSISKTIIEKHGGRLELVRRRHPTIFEVTLPLAKTQIDRAQAS